MNKGEHMEKELNECYDKMYKLCKKNLPIEWTEVKIWTEKYDQEDCWDYHALLYYKDINGKWYSGAEIEDDFSKDAFLKYALDMPSEVVEDIYKIFDEAGMEKFKVFTYTVDADGHFEVNFQYEYSQGETFLQRMILWEYETIGFTGSDFHKDIIKKYHPEANV